MYKPVVLLLFFCCSLISGAQTVSQKLEKAFAVFETSPQLQHALVSLYVIDAKTGQVLFGKNSGIGMAGASTQKIITAATAFEILGPAFTYTTNFYRDSSGTNNELWVEGSGDPSFGSDRYASTKPMIVTSAIRKAMQQNGLSPVKLKVLPLPTGFESQLVPDRWIWQDMGNYYGAGAAGFNWKENQADLYLSSGSAIGDPVRVLKIDSSTGITNIKSEATAAAKGSGDNAYFYLPYGNSSNAIVRGTIPVNENNFGISIAVPDPLRYFSASITGNQPGSLAIESTVAVTGFPKSRRLVYAHRSPSLDSLVYWFLRKSINLYGEALLKTIGKASKGTGSTEQGLTVLKDFWKSKGIDTDELNMYDGSGLSPMNRITTHVQVEILRYARSAAWFRYFYEGLPEYNGMKMKSGTIGDVKGFCGYHTSKSGNEYIFSFIINNYSGKTSPVVNGMYKVLDVLK